MSDAHTQYTWIDVCAVPQLRETLCTNQGVTIGSSVTLAETECFLNRICSGRPGDAFRLIVIVKQ